MYNDDTEPTMTATDQLHLESALAIIRDTSFWKKWASGDLDMCLTRAVLHLEQALQGDLWV